MLYTLNLYITCQVYLIKKNTLGFQSHPFIFLTLFSFPRFCPIKISQCHLHYHHGLSLWRWECVFCRTSLCQAFPSLLHMAHPLPAPGKELAWCRVGTWFFPSWVGSIDISDHSGPEDWGRSRSEVAWVKVRCVKQLPGKERCRTVTSSRQHRPHLTLVGRSRNRVVLKPPLFSWM